MQTTYEEQLSSLFGSYKAEWLRDQIFDLFAEPSYLPELATARPCVLVGGRGTGKTTVLRGLTYEGQMALYGEGLNDPEDLPFVGLYYRVETSKVSYFNGPELQQREWERLFAHYLNLIFCNLIADFIEWYGEASATPIVISADECKRVADSLHLGPVKNVSQLCDSLRVRSTKFEAAVNNVADSSNLALSMLGAPVEYFTSALLDLPQFSGKQFFILIDEYENFTDYQQQVLNTLIKHTKPAYTFKVGVRRLGWRVRSTLNQEERLISPADYVVVDIESRLQGNFDTFAESVCNARLNQFEKQSGESVLPVRDALASLTEDSEAELLGVGEVDFGQQLADPTDELARFFQNLTPLQKYFLFYWSRCKGSSLTKLTQEAYKEPRRFKTRYNNYKHAILYTIRRGKSGVRKYYCGWEVFTKLASNNIRYLLELVDRSYVMHLKSDETLDANIRPQVQTQICQEVARKNLRELEGLSVDGAHLTKLLLGLGRIFQVMALQPEGHAPEVNQFDLSRETSDIGGSGSSENIDVDRLLKAAVMHLVLLQSPGNKLADEGDTRDSDYMIHPIFSPFFEYSYRRKRKMKLAPGELGALVANPRETIRAILKRMGRNDNSGMELPPQLMLFSPYYEST